MRKPMRKADCQVDREGAMKILEQCEYLSIAMLNEDGSPYNVVVNSIYDQGKIYFHSANEGQKLDCIRHDPRVCITGFSGATTDSPNATTRYASVVVYGKASILEDKERKIQLIRKKSVEHNVTEEKILSNLETYFDLMTIVEIEIEEITGKVNKA